MKFRVDEAINRKDEKVRVKFQGWYDERNKVCNNYYLFYDEDEIYHVENSVNKKIVYTFSCNSWTKAVEISLKHINKDKENMEGKHE
jgi:hypothetical protein